jgi:hypothetical protein
VRNSKVIVDFEIRNKKLASLPILVLDSRSRFVVSLTALSETKLISILLSLRLSRINFYILAQDQHIKPSLAQLMDRISGFINEKK